MIYDKILRESSWLSWTRVTIRRLFSYDSFNFSVGSYWHRQFRDLSYAWSRRISSSRQSSTFCWIWSCYIFRIFYFERSLPLILSLSYGTSGETKLEIDPKEFWRWCIALRFTGVFDFVSNVLYSRNHKTQHFEDWIFFLPQVRGMHLLSWGIFRGLPSGPVYIFILLKEYVIVPEYSLWNL
jgi:hypothetical protein